MTYYIESDIWFQDDLWEASSIRLQNSFSKTLYLKEVLASVPRYFASWEMLSGFLSCQFWSIFLHCCALLPMYSTPWTTGPCSQWCHFLTGGVFECVITHRRTVAVLCMVYKISCNPMHLLNGALPGLYVPVRVTCGLWSHIGMVMRRLAAEVRSIAGLLFTSQCPSGTILRPCI